MCFLLQSKIVFSSIPQFPDEYVISYLVTKGGSFRAIISAVSAQFGSFNKDYSNRADFNIQQGEGGEEGEIRSVSDSGECSDHLLVGLAKRG